MGLATVARALLLLNTTVAAHMALTDPPPIKHKDNPHTGANIDYQYIDPMSHSGSDFPCKGHLDVLDSPMGEPVATWEAGQSYSMTITGGAIHNGGSCQASLSHDGGHTFKVIHSWVGNCPGQEGENTYSFTLPSDTPNANKALFAWTWFNNLGNREMYMNCAVVTISGSSKEEEGSFGSRPNIFVANVGNGCATIESRDVMFPNPGSDVTVRDPGAAAFPQGTCETGPGAPEAGGTPDSDSESDRGARNGGGGSGISEELQGALVMQGAAILLLWLHRRWLVEAGA